MRAPVRGLRQEDGGWFIGVIGRCEAAPGDINCGRLAGRNAGVEDSQGVGSQAQTEDRDHLARRYGPLGQAG